MNSSRMRLLCALAISGLALLSSVQSHGAERNEYQFDLLQIGTRFFTNATVTTGTESYIFVSHARGLENVKISDLPMDLREKLGFEIPKPKTNAIAGWTKAQVSRISRTEVKDLKENWRAHLPVQMSKVGPIPPSFVYGAIVALVLIYLFFCYCAMLICQKAGNPPGPLIWIPIVQFIPLFRAANLSPWWVLALLVPIVNFVVQIIWAFKIVEARAKSPLVAVLLILPVTNLFALLYLAFASAAPKQKAEKKVHEIMTLETA